MNEAEEIELQIPGLKIAGKRWGKEGGIPVLATHGWLDNAATFDRLVPYLSDMDLVSIDYPGHGRSEHLRKGAPYHFFDLVMTTFDIADALGWERFNLLGHSMGGAAATLVAGTYPERIDRVVLIDSIGPWSTPPEETPTQMEEGLDERKMLLSKSNRVFESREAASEVIGELYGLSPEEISPLLERGLINTEKGVQLTYDLQLRGTSMLRLTEPQVRSYLQRISSPVFYIRPKDGWPYDEEIVKQRMELVTNIHRLDVRGGHHVQLGSPARIGQPIDEFLHSE